jgi:hypothetical protein
MSESDTGDTEPNDDNDDLFTVASHATSPIASDDDEDSDASLLIKDDDSDGPEILERPAESAQEELSMRSSLYYSITLTYNSQIGL